MTMNPSIKNPSIKVEQFIQAPVAKVFEAWADNQKFDRWMGQPMCSCTSRHRDFREGGSYDILMQFNDEEAPFCRKYGEFLEIIPNEKIVFTWAYDLFKTPEGKTRDDLGAMPDGEACVSTVTVLFSEVNGGTRVELTHEGTGPGFTCMMESYNRGWTNCLDSIEKLAFTSAEG